LEPFLPEEPGRFLKGVEEIDAEFGGLCFELEEARARERTLPAGLIGGETHDPAAAAGKHAKIRADEARELVDQGRDALRVRRLEPEVGTIKCEDRGLLKFARDLFAHKKPV